MRHKWSDLGQALRALRTARDLSQTEVIDRSGVKMGERTLRTYESGQQRPSRNRLLWLLTKSFELRSAAEITRHLQIAGYAVLTDSEMLQFGLDPAVAKTGVSIPDRAEKPVLSQAEVPAAVELAAQSAIAKAYLAKIRDEWDAQAEAAPRRLFWETLDACYARHCLGQPGYPDTLEELVDSARAPQDLPLPEGENLRDYAARCLETLTGPDLLLHQFCNLVYPAKDPARSLKDCSRLDPKAFDEFHMHARWRFTRFWNRVGEAVYVERLVDLQTLMRYLEGSHRIIQMLVYLEVSLIRWTRDSGMGGRWFFQLNQDWGTG